MTVTVPISGDTTVRELVGRYPKTRRVFETSGIDYCCGGAKSLADAACEHGLRLPELVNALETAVSGSPDKDQAADKDWYAASLRELVQHIVASHHAYMKAALPRLRTLVPKVRNAHGAHHGDVLDEVQRVFNALDEEISSHLMKEEMILFPYVEGLEASVREGAPMPHACFGSARYPIGQMEHEHESAGHALARLREVTNDYTLPPDACPSFSAMYEELRRMEADLHQHIHLENNILFPRAIELEGRVGGEAS